MTKSLSRLALIAALGAVSPALAQDAEGGAAPAEGAAAEAAPAPEPQVSRVDEILGKMPAMYRKRDQGTTAQDAIKLLEEAKVLEPQNYEVRWRLAQFHYWIADTSAKDAMAREGKLGWDEAEAAKKINPNGVEGYYWAAACVGAYSTGKGIVTAVSEGLSPVFKENAERAEKIDANHDNAGPLRALGRYYFKLPWPLADKEKARSYLERAVKAGPKSARSWYYLADLERDAGNTDKAKEILNKIVAMDPNDGDPPDIRLHQKKAREMLAEL